MKRRIGRKAFTLIELLTVMAIITILIGILTPALTGARDNARKTAIKGQINAIEVGLMAFSNDEGEFVPSNAVFFANDIYDANGMLTQEMADWEVGDTTTPLQGAHLLLDAMVGRDFLGYDPKAPPFGPGGQSQPDYDRWARTNDRRLPYIPVDGVDATSEEDPPDDAFGGNPDTNQVQPVITGSGQEPMLCRAFRDKFGWPILYYRASPTANQNTPIVTAFNATPPPEQYFGNGVYDGLDNEFFTSYAYGNPPTHKIADAHLGLDVDPPPADYGVALENRFAEFIRSLRASTYITNDPTHISHPRPVKFERFIILSAGKDGIYGNLDDVANYNVFSEER